MNQKDPGQRFHASYQSVRRCAVSWPHPAIYARGDRWPHSLASLLVAACQPVVEVPQPHNIVVVHDAAHAAPVPAAAADLLPVRLACTQQPKGNNKRVFHRHLQPFHPAW